MNTFSLLRRPVVVLLTLPAGIALFLCVLPFATMALDYHFAGAGPSALRFSEESARTLLTVVAGGAMTALSLTYSLVLVVFTLAAGNIGPRLLARFASEPVNQVTAGILGGTFLYSLTTLVFMKADFVPGFTVAGSGALAIISVVQLIYFVRHVSESVSVDSEIADISHRLTKQLEALIAASADDEEAFSGDSEFGRTLSAPQAGYFSIPAPGRLAALAAEHDMRIRFSCPPGDFVTTGTPLATCDRDIGEELAEKLADAISLTASRVEDGSPRFSINLLVEIALRALSPGVNDTFTAIAVSNSLSESLSRMKGSTEGGTVHAAEDGSARVYVPAQGFEQLLAQSFDPLRRAATGNVLMYQALARALSRLRAVEEEDGAEIVERHADLLMRAVKDNVPYKEDVASVEAYLLEPDRGEASARDK